ncbi:hypothetical protein ACJVDH_04655 [Pedobacter sp. AW1-32]|uniref:hypothetical protein n=1 Tax=Pedobacter sp. AW1-32 TaxID=3383026 RepID=UPI003FEDACA2
MKTHKIYASIFAFCLMVSACTQVSKSIKETFITTDSAAKQQSEKTESTTQVVTETIVETHATMNHEQPIHLLQQPNQLRAAEQDLRQLPQYKNKEIFIYETIHFYDNGRIHVTLRHPTNTKYIDSYEYADGKWSAPKPKQMSVRDEIDRKLISLDQLHFIDAAKVAAIYNQKSSEVEGAKPATSIYTFVRDGNFKWYPRSISGSRERYSIEFNMDGSLKSFTQD